MDIEEYRHLEGLLSQYRKNLRQLEMRSADYGTSAVPLSLSNDIEKEKRRIVETESILQQYEIIEAEDDYINKNSSPASQTVYQQRNYQNSRSYKEKDPARNIEWIIPLAIVAIPIILYLIFHIPDKINESFSISNGLGAWRTNGIVTLIKDGQEENEQQRNGAAQITIGAFMYQTLPEIAKKDDIYSAKVWCKAPIGTLCRIFLGDLQKGLKPPVEDGDSTIYRSGTDKWESLQVTIKMETD